MEKSNNKNVDRAIVRVWNALCQNPSLVVYVMSMSLVGLALYILLQMVEKL